MNPYTFAAVTGQEKAKKILARVSESGRLAHAYLFRGPDGVGKRLCAGVFAAGINCRTPSSEGGCGHCPSCLKYVSGNHPDIVLVAPEKGTIRIDRIRALCQSLAYPPYESETRVVIIEDVHTMRGEAANSLLKTLEEPPPGNLLILTSESNREVLATIVSRCQIVPFFGLRVRQTIDVIRANDPGIGETEAEMLGRLTEGSPGKALLLKEKKLVRVWESVIAAVEQPVKEASAEVLLAEAEKIAALKEDIVHLLGLLRIWVRDRMLRDAGSGDIDQPLERFRLKAIDQAERELARNCNRTLVSEVLLFNLQSPRPRLFF